MLLTKQLIMTIGITPNNWELTREMVENSLIFFDNVPIVHNDKQKYKDYTIGFENYYDNNPAIGIICVNPNVIIENNNVYADIFIKEEYEHLWKGKFDNWCLEPSDDKKSFKLMSIEVF